MVWSPFASGFLTGKYTPDNPVPDYRRRAKFDFPPIDVQRDYEAMDGFLKNSKFPEDFDEITLCSYIVTGLNSILYASLEKPQIVTEDRCEFDILWCPHQNRYTAFDCRVQRYFVEGMIQAVDDNGLPKFTAWVEKLIPHGAQCCHFVVQKRKDSQKPNPWHDYSDELGKRAFKKMEGKE